MVLEIDGEIAHYGCDCAGAAIHGKKSSSNTATIAKKASLLEIIEKVRATTGTVKGICQAQGFWFDKNLNAYTRGDGLTVAA